MTPKDILEETIPAKLRGHPEKVSGVKGVIQFDISGADGGQWFLDCTTEPCCVKAGEKSDALVTISISDSDFVRLVDGEINPQMAFLTGKLKVKGDMGIALKLGAILT